MIEPQKELDFLKPAAAGGLALGLLSSIPILQYGNCLCCMWILGGGGLAAYLLNQQRPGGLTYGDGAFGGIISGVIGAIVSTLVSIPVRMMMADQLAQARTQMEEVFNQTPNFPPFMRNLFEQMLSPEITIGALLFGFIIAALMYGLFAMIGGILMVAILNRKKAAQ
jgi:hypothetical protein